MNNIKTLENIKSILEGCIAQTQKDFDRRLKDYGKNDSMTNWTEGCLSAYEVSLNLIQNHINQNK